MDNKNSNTHRKLILLFLVITIHNCGLQDIETIDVIQPFPVESFKLISKGWYTFRFELGVRTSSRCWRFYKEEIKTATNRVYVKILLHNRGDACPPEDRVMNIPIFLSVNDDYATAEIKFWRSDTSSLDTTLILRE